MMVDRADGPVFVLGILPRSGTNLLFNLLRLHPDFGVAEPIWEDYLLEPSELLVQYARAVYAWWEAADPPWGVDKGLESQLCRHLGRGLISFFESQISEHRLLTKTPSVSCLGNFFRFFPDAYLLVLVRDGRDVVESAERSFGWDRDVTTRRWAQAAKAILTFDRDNRERGLPYLITRYEDLHTDLEHELRKVLAFVKLDAARYDFDAARELPVYGSSTVQEAGNSVHWRPIPKTRDFNPIERWSGWSRRMHERFNWLAGRYSVELGYEPRTYSDHERAWALYNKAVDAVQRHEPYRLIPPFAWKFIKTAGYRLLRAGGIDL